MTLEFDSGSFRDPDSRVVLRDAEVLRVFSQSALDQWREISRSHFYGERVAAGDIVSSVEEPAADLPFPWAGIVRTDRIPVISYPYEWSFGMLKACAVLQLDLLLEALRCDASLKDATPFNFQWRNLRPVFIDIGSFEKRNASALWNGYRQFCETFLNPLLLASLRNVDFRPWLRGRLDGVESAQLVKLLSLSDLVRPGVLKHVFLHAKAASRVTPSSRIQQDVSALGVDTAGLVRTNVVGLRRMILGLEVGLPKSQWTSYEYENPYDEADRQAKEDFVRRHLDLVRPKQVLDLGCNTGAYSRLAAPMTELVVAVDSDPAVIETLYSSLRIEGPRNILPLVWDFADPSPALGWRHAERSPLEKRMAPDVVLALAVVHHLSLGRNLPTNTVVEALADLGGDLLVEFPSAEDRMVQSILARKKTHSFDYRQDRFEELLAARMDVVDRLILPSTTRTLYYARRRIRL